MKVPPQPARVAEPGPRNSKFHPGGSPMATTSMPSTAWQASPQLPSEDHLRIRDLAEPLLRDYAINRRKSLNTLKCRWSLMALIWSRQSGSSRPCAQAKPSWKKRSGKLQGVRLRTGHGLAQPPLGRLFAVTLAKRAQAKILHCFTACVPGTLPSPRRPFPAI
jgi:hypothetical protein